MCKCFRASAPSEQRLGFGKENRGDRIRTCDFLVPNQALYQAELRPGGTRPYLQCLGMCKKRLLENDSKRFHRDGRAVAENLRGREICPEIGSIVTHTEDGIGSEFDSVGHHGVVSMLTPLLTHLGVSSNATSDNALQTAKEPLRDSRRSNDDATNHPLVSGDPATWDVKCGGDEHGILWIGNG